MAPSFITPLKLFVAALVLIGAVFTCAVIAARDNQSWLGGGESAGLPMFLAPTQQAQAQAQAEVLVAAEVEMPQAPSASPTPDAPHTLPTLRASADEYVIQVGDTLNRIAGRYQVSVNDILEYNDLENADLIEPGQQLIIPPPEPGSTGPDFKVLPDSELVYGPGSAEFDVGSFVHAQGGYLSTYKEDVEDRQMSGVKIVERVAHDFSVNPRLLLAALEYQSGWVTQANPDEDTLEYPLGWYDEVRPGLYRQLAWAADALNRGYYLWRVNGASIWELADGNVVPIAATINAGTAGVQHFFSLLHGAGAWEQAVSEQGLYATYLAFFGNPFAYAAEPILPPDLVQPELRLPFKEGQTWYFTGGPHGGWANGSAWAALDFAPPGQALGCVQSEAWVTAVADGPVVRTGNGAVVQDLDGDGFEQTGWTLLYMHIESRDRVEEGEYLETGERVGHPSCEGGFSTGTHLHLARRYNGEWIPADQDLPFVLDEWVSIGLGYEYDGYLKRGEDTVEALEGRQPENAIER
jgi:LysM repeat protein